MARLICTLAVCSVVMLGAPLPAKAWQALECDSTFVRLRKDGDQGYQRRPGAAGLDRCEGTFTPEVDDDNLWVAGFFEAFADFPSDSILPLDLTWDAPGAAPTYITVHSVRLDEPYRMDTRVPEDRTSFGWSTGVVSPLGLERTDLTPMAFSFDERGALYLPLRVAPGGEAEGSGQYTLVVVPTSRLNDVRVNVARVEAAGDMPSGGEYLVYDESVGEDDLYITREPIYIGIDQPEEEGIYVVEVQGIRDSGDALPTLVVWFYHPGS